MAVINSQENGLVSPMPWHQETWVSLVGQYTRGRLPHAILLGGLQGAGKRQLAMAFGQFLLCEQPDSRAACGTCHSCQMNSAQTHPDLFLLEPEEEGKQIKVDQVRELSGFIGKTANQAGNRVVLIHPAESMNINAANSLLKNLEEPGAKTFLILVTHRPGDLIATIRSRCQSQPIGLPGRDQVIAWLQTEVGGEENAILESALTIARGQPLKARQYLLDGVLELYKRIQSSAVDLAITKLSPVEAAELWNQQPEQVLEWLVSWLKDLAYCHAGAADRIEDPAGAARIRPLWERSSPGKLHDLMSALLLALRQMRSTANPNKQLLLEDIAIRWKGCFTGR